MNDLCHSCWERDLLVLGWSSLCRLNGMKKNSENESAYTREPLSDLCITVGTLVAARIHNGAPCVR